MSTPVNPFKDTAAASIWSGQDLTHLRTQAAEETTNPDLMTEIEKLDARIAAFETASISASVAGASNDYPFDRARLKREFLDEALALIIRTSREANHPTATTGDVNDIRLNLTVNPLTATTAQTAGDSQLNLRGNIETLTAASSLPNGGTQVFDNSEAAPTSGGLPDPASGGPFYQIYITQAATKEVYQAYAALIDAAFAAGDKMANQTLDASQVVTAIRPIEFGDVTYDRIGTYSDITAKDTTGNPRLTQYLVASGTENEKALGSTALSSNPSSRQMVKLDAHATTVLSTALGVTTYQDATQGVWAKVTEDAAGNVSVQGSLNGTAYTAATKVSIPLAVAYGLGISPAPSDGNLPIELDAYRFTGSDGSDYLIGHYAANSGGSDRVFTYKLASIGSTQLASLTDPPTIAGVTYDRIATYSDPTSTDAALNPLTTQYLVSNVTRGDGSSAMLKLNAHATTLLSQNTTRSYHQDSVLGVKVMLVSGEGAGDGTWISRDGGLSYARASQVSIPLSVASGLGITPAPGDGNLPIALEAYRYTHDPRLPGADGYDYLVGKYQNADGSERVFTYKLDPAVGNDRGITLTKSLTAPEYLLHWTEARIKVLTGQLNFQKNIITEIQNDLAQANDALAELQKQVAALGTSELGASAATLKLSLFNATHATAGNPFLTWDNPATRDQIFSKLEWESVRVNLKNYIDRRSSEAQQATLDYQSTLNRYNSAYEIMGKMQEKLDNLVKSQLRNLS